MNCVGLSSLTRCSKTTWPSCRYVESFLIFASKESVPSTSHKYSKVLMMVERGLESEYTVRSIQNACQPYSGQMDNTLYYTAGITVVLRTLEVNDFGLMETKQCYVSVSIRCVYSDERTQPLTEHTRYIFGTTTTTVPN